MRWMESHWIISPGYLSTQQFLEILKSFSAVTKHGERTVMVRQQVFNIEKIPPASHWPCLDTSNGCVTIYGEDTF